MQSYLVTSRCTESGETDQTIIVTVESHSVAMLRAITSLHALCMSIGSGYFEDGYFGRLRPEEIGPAAGVWQYREIGEEAEIWTHVVIAL